MSEDPYRMGARDVTREPKWMQMLEMSLLWGQERVQTSSLCNERLL